MEKTYYILSLKLTKLDSNEPNTICNDGIDIGISDFINTNTFQCLDVRDIKYKININDLYFTLDKINKKTIELNLLTYIQNNQKSGLNNNTYNETNNFITIATPDTLAFDEPVTSIGKEEFQFAHETKQWNSEDYFYSVDNLDFDDPILSFQDVYNTLDLYVSDQNGVDFQNIHYPFLEEFNVDQKIIYVEEDGTELFYYGTDEVYIPYKTDDLGFLRYYLNEYYYTEQELIDLGYSRSPIE